MIRINKYINLFIQIDNSISSRNNKDWTLYVLNYLIYKLVNRSNYLLRY